MARLRNTAVAVFQPGSGYEGPTHSWKKAKHRFMLRFLAADRVAALAQQQGKTCPGTGYETRLS